MAPQPASVVPPHSRAGLYPPTTIPSKSAAHSPADRSGFPTSPIGSTHPTYHLTNRKVVDLTTYNTLSSTARRTIYKYDWEEELNDAKRKIKLLDKRFLDKVRDEVETVLRDGI